DRPCDPADEQFREGDDLEHVVDRIRGRPRAHRDGCLPELGRGSSAPSGTGTFGAPGTFFETLSLFFLVLAHNLEPLNEVPRFRSNLELLVFLGVSSQEPQRRGSCRFRGSSCLTRGHRPEPPHGSTSAALTRCWLLRFNDRGGLAAHRAKAGPVRLSGGQDCNLSTYRVVETSARCARSRSGDAILGS